MNYADFEYYTNEYGGSAISEEAFSVLAAKSSAFIDRVTMGRAADHADNDRLKCCCCDLAETLHSAEDTNGMVKQSESVGSWSYTLNSSASDKTVEDFMYAKCRTWLPSEWLYRGVARE